MPTLAPDPVKAKEFVEQYLVSRDRWIHCEHDERFDQVRQAFTAAFDSGTFKSMAELGQHFMVPGEMARRIYQGIRVIGKEQIQLLTRDLGIPDSACTKLNFILNELLPIYESMGLADKDIDADNVEVLVNRIGRLDWDQYQSAGYERWATIQAQRFPDYTRSEIDAAAFWLAFRPRLPGYPNFLIRAARKYLTKADADAFQQDTWTIQCLRNSACSVESKRAREFRGLSDDLVHARILAYMDDDLRDRSSTRFDAEDVAIGLMHKHGLDLGHLLTLTTGELLEHSPITRSVSDRFLSLPS